MAVLGITAGFQSAHATDDYGYLQGRPLPKTSEEHDSECAWIRSEEARIQSQADQGLTIAAKYNSPKMTDSIKTTAIRDLGHLDDRYAQIQCALIGRKANKPAVPRAPELDEPYPAAAAPSQAAAVAPPTQPAMAPPPTAAAPAPPALAPAPAPAAVTAPRATVPPQPATVPPPAVPAQSGGGLTFDQCFAKCGELTKRTAEQCFDACRH